LGDKISSTIIAQTSDVPCVSWSGSGVLYNLPEDASRTIPDDIYAKCCVPTCEAAEAAAQKIGFPLMIKVNSHFLFFFFSAQHFSHMFVNLFF